MIQVKANIAAMTAYTAAWKDLDRRKYLRLDLNENTQPLPEHVNDALRRLIEERSLQMYPSYERFLPKLSQYANIGRDNLVITNGSDQAIHIILTAFLGRGDTLLIAEPEFPIFSQSAHIIGANIRKVPYQQDMSFPFEQFCDAIGDDTQLIVIINPNNPTGTLVSIEQIEIILSENLDIPVIVDEAYFEFTGVTSQCLLDKFPNLIIIRTFSKAFAMAGLRLGYILASVEITSQLYKIRPPFDVNCCALVAAEAQMDHPAEWQTYVREVMTVSKPMLENFFDQQGVSYYRGAANFMLVRSKQRDEIVQYLQEHGILVRPMMATLIKDTFRLGIGTALETQRFIEVFRGKK
jgi:histidinol-phosphate aminotransferase